MDQVTRVPRSVPLPAVPRRVGPQPDSPIPPTIWPVSVVAPADSLRTTHKKEPIKIAVAAMDAILPVVYGSQHIQGLIANVLLLGKDFVWWVWWCEGPIQAIDAITLAEVALNDKAAGGVKATVTNYLGDAGNVVDPTLHAAYAAQTPAISYNETLPGVAYSVIRIDRNQMNGAPNFGGRIRGRKVYDPRQDSTNGGSGSQRLTDATTWTYARNPALILADFLKATDYGCGLTLDWPSVIVAANANDALVGTAPTQEPSRVADLILEQPSTLRDWKETLRTAAGCLIVESQNVAKLVPDVAGTPVAAYAHSAGNIVAISNLALPDPTQLPTVLDITYTDTTKTPWAQANTPAVYRPGADLGLIPWRRSTVPMPWIQSLSQAKRESVERMNKLWLRGLTFTLEVFNEGMVHTVGDLITVDYPEHGLNVLPVKVTSSTPSGSGGWLLQCQKEDAAAYSSIVEANPTTGNTQLPLPGAPPMPTGLTWAEELYTDALGKIKSRMRATWDDMSDYLYFTTYRVEVYSGGVLMGEPTMTVVPEIAWGPVQEGLAYTIHVHTQSQAASSDAAIATATAQGKLAKPADVARFSAYDLAGVVYFQWTPAADLDLTAHELRYGLTTDTWEQAKLVDRVPMPMRTYSTNTIAPGARRFFIKALDSIRTAQYPNGQESVNALYADVTVTQGANSRVTYPFDNSPTLTAMLQLNDGSWVTDNGTSWGTLFPNALSTYTDPLASYSAGTSSLVSNAVDAGAGSNMSGVLMSDMDYVDIAGTAQPYIEYSTGSSPGPSWTRINGTVGSATFRWVRVGIETTGSVLVRDIGDIAVQS